MISSKEANLQQESKQEDHEVVVCGLSGFLLLRVGVGALTEGKRGGKLGGKVQGALHGWLPLEDDEGVLEEGQEGLMEGRLVFQLV